MSAYAVRRATPADEGDLMALRIEAEEWLAEAGIDQWRSPGVRERALAKWRADIERGRTWAAENAAGSIVATVTLAPPDLDFWNEDDDPDDAVYVAKLITSRAAAGQHLGGRILDWAASFARARGLSWVRLDCWRSNEALQRYYLREGFTHVRTEAPEHRLSGWMAQRPSSVTMHPHDPVSERQDALTSTVTSTPANNGDRRHPTPAQRTSEESAVRDQ